ncbi:uncharacterized protein ELE39_003558 [Cryptosporidium sp. chipmunk genotype I]|uniref:uncharacterized protein n=1 Tax=Cryptosporidium sp. chipmunk genotype I TaxID=1280935 RepID=UPI00351A0033|nr:hypothetical protein ELE39_003558 [Cryptosporidium sp. chipmunk genotype I]
MDPQFRFNLRPVIQNKNNSGAPKVFVRSTSTGNNVQSISKTPIVPYRQIYGTNFNEQQGVYSTISPLQSFRTPRLENQHYNNFISENKNYSQINTERQIYSTNNSAEDPNIITYRSESFIQVNSLQYKPNELFESTNYSSNTTFSESQLSSNQLFESENDSFISQNRKPSKNLMHTVTNTLDNKSKNELKQSIIDPKDHPSIKIEESIENHKEIDFEDQINNISLNEIYEIEQLDHLPQLISTAKEKIDLEEIEYDIPDTNNNNFDRESIISSSDTQGCMEICITPPLSSELIISNDFYLPDNKEESQNDSVLKIKEICEDFSKIETHKNNILENQNITKEYGSGKFRFSSFCPKLLNCLFPWIRSEQYFEDYDQPIFYVTSNNEESQKLINC